MYYVNKFILLYTVAVFNRRLDQITISRNVLNAHCRILPHTLTTIRKIGKEKRDKEGAIRQENKITVLKKLKKENIFDNIYATTTNGFVLLINHFLPKSVIIKGPIFLKISAWYWSIHFISFSLKRETSINFFWIGMCVNRSNPRNPVRIKKQRM